MRIVAIMLLAGMATGAFVGFAAGALWTVFRLPRLSAAAAAAVALVAIALDVAARVAGRPSPPAVRRQVPQEWGRILDLRLASLLYGARLGIGPLTLLPTWLWWGALVVGASTGAWPSALVGATFHVARTATMIAAVAGARPSSRSGTQPPMSSRMASLRRGDVPVTATLLVVLGCWALVLAR